MEEFEFMCCFCGDSIDSSSVDPCAVVLIGNWKSPDVDQQVEQQFFCHVTCFKKAVDSKVPVEIEEMLTDALESNSSAG